MAFSPEYQDVYDALVTAGDTPSSDVANYQDQLTRRLVSKGYWTRMDLLYIFAQEYNSGGGALINWPNPGTFDATAVNSPTFTSLEGFTSDASTSYLNTNWDPVNNGSNFTLDDSGAGIYHRNPAYNTSFTRSFGNRGTDSFTLIASMSGNVRSSAYGGSSIVMSSSNSGDASGSFMVTRRGDTDQEQYARGVSGDTDSTASGSLYDEDFYILCYNYTASPAEFTGNPASFFFTMDGMSDAEALELNNIFATYMYDIGKGVADPLLVSCYESLSVTETQTADTGEETGTTAESLSITEAQTGQAARDGADAESASISEAQIGQAEFNDSVSESASISEAQTADEENEAAISESASIDEVSIAQSELNDDTSESASISESQTGNVVPGGITGATAESVSIDDAPTVQAELSASVAESFSIGETCDAQLISYPDITESLAITAVEGVLGQEIFNERYISGVVQDSVSISGVVQESVSITGSL